MKNGATKMTWLAIVCEVYALSSAMAAPVADTIRRGVVGTPGAPCYRSGMRASVMTNLLILLIFAFAAALYFMDEDAYYAVAQEDRPLEWLTFWLFATAGAAFVRSAGVELGRRGGVPWFTAGLGLFCLFVALEEISWGQRLFGYRPPDYFLEENFQQEFNLHNILGTNLRMVAMHAVLVGYGVALGLAATLPAVRRILSRWRIVSPPAALAPGFAIIAAVYAWYPADFTGEWVEAAMSIGFVGAAAASVTPDRRTRTVVSFVLAAVVATGGTLGLLTLLHGSDAERTRAARAEVAALAEDFKGPRLRTRCNIHKRLYTFMREYNQPYVAQGTFSDLVRQTSDSTRASYVLDPWNSPYWVRHICADGEAAAFVYSFGPNRRRDSSQWEIAGDDVGAYLFSR